MLSDLEEHNDRASLLAQIATLQARLAALRPFIRHDDDCDWLEDAEKVCDCGLLKCWTENQGR